MLVKITLHDGIDFQTEMTDFNLAEFIEKVNSSQSKLIQFGDYGILTNTIKIVDASNKTV